LDARWARLALAHGAPPTSSETVIGAPWSVVMVIGRVPVVGRSLVAGLPTSLRLGLLAASAAVQAQMSAAASSFGSESKPPSTHTVPTTISASATAAPTPAWMRRLRRVCAALRAICRSYLARASLRCRVLLEATRAPLPQSAAATKPQRTVRDT
jgi:hypothetical protein